MPTHRYMTENELAAMLAIKRSAGIQPEVNLREHVIYIYMPLPSANKLPLALEPRGDITRSPKQGYQWPHLCPPKIFKKIQMCINIEISPHSSDLPANINV